MNRGHKEELKDQAPGGSSFLDLAKDACPCKPRLWWLFWREKAVAISSKSLDVSVMWKKAKWQKIFPLQPGTTWMFDLKNECAGFIFVAVLFLLHPPPDLSPVNNHCPLPYYWNKHEQIWITLRRFKEKSFHTLSLCIVPLKGCLRKAQLTYTPSIF